MVINYQDLGSQLVDACKAVGENASVLLVAPFIKEGALRKILSHCAPEQHLQVITRWRLDEIAAGASDPEIWELLKSRASASLWLRANLHAKYYRFGSTCYIGSANVTDSALGWSGRPNLELLAQLPPGETELAGFEEKLRKNCVKVSQHLYEQLVQLREEYEQLDNRPAAPDHLRFNAAQSMGLVSEPEVGSGMSEPQQVNHERWIPHLRYPEELYRAYTGDLDALTTATRRHGLRDLRFLNIPEGLPEEAFNKEVKWQLLQMPVVQKVDNYVQVSRRFGAVRDYLQTLPCSEEPGFNATEAWQTLMRWLLYFLEDRYDCQEANYSEIFVRRS